MTRGAKVGVGAALGVVAIYTLAIVVPFNPDERRPGTRLSGELVAEPVVDWAFVGPERVKIYVQTRTPYLVPHSITAVGWVAEGSFYVGCRACDTKTWPRYVATDNRVRIKIGEQLYERRAIRVDDVERRRIFGVPAGEALPDAALFRMDPV